jgi:CBS domain-containing protein
MDKSDIAFSTGEPASRPVPAFDLHGRESIDLTDDDPTHRVGHLERARKKPLSVPPTATVREATTLMMLHKFSQLPVMASNKKVKGIFSWKSFAQRLSAGRQPVFVTDAMETAVVVSVKRSLFEAARNVADSDYVLIQDDADGTICGILTAYDLSLAFSERSEPFLLLEQIEKQLRNLVRRKITADELRRALDLPDEYQIEVNELGFRDYVKLLRRPEYWNKIGLCVDQGLFVTKLDEIRKVRNTVMHFDLNGIAIHDIKNLRDFASFLRQIRRALE